MTSTSSGRLQNTQIFHQTAGLPCKLQIFTRSTKTNLPDQKYDNIKQQKVVIPHLKVLFILLLSRWFSGYFFILGIQNTKRDLIYVS